MYVMLCILTIGQSYELFYTQACMHLYMHMVPNHTTCHYTTHQPNRRKLVAMVTMPGPHTCVACRVSKFATCQHFTLNVNMEQLQQRPWKGLGRLQHNTHKLHNCGYLPNDFLFLCMSSAGSTLSAAAAFPFSSAC